MQTSAAPLPHASITNEPLRLSDLTAAGASCTASDPGPDPSYDPDPIPDEGGGGEKDE